MRRLAPYVFRLYLWTLGMTAAQYFDLLGRDYEARKRALEWASEEAG